MSPPLVDTVKFAVLRRSARIWAVAAIHGEADRLTKLHREIAHRFVPGDRLVYLGNVLGHGPSAAVSVDRLLAFRRAVIGSAGMFANDVAVLRGAQEEMFQKLLQLQLALNPPEVLEWMLDHGVGPTLESYGGSGTEGLAAARAGVAMCGRWTSELRDKVQAHPGHNQFFSALRRAAVSEPARPQDGRLLLVSAGLDVSRPLAAQKDSFWWPPAGFEKLAEPYGEFSRIVRGSDPQHPGIAEGPFTLTVDGGAGFGGPLLSVCLDTSGAIADTIEV